MTKLTRTVAIAGVVAAAMAIALTSSQTAAAGQTAAASQTAAATINPFAASRTTTASKRTVAARRACGFVGGETYRHCASRTHVLIDAKNIWGTTYRNICVGPGDTHLGYLSYWVISYAWYIGKLCRG
jgi:hypothetical protein